MTEAHAALILTTVGSAEDAARISRQLVEERSAACVSAVSGVRSVYRWQGVVVEEEEHLLLVKAPPSAVGRLRARILALHPYEVPELLVLDAADVPDAYARWLEDSTSG